MFPPYSRSGRRDGGFVVTTNERHPLCDPTGSRRFLCIQIPSGDLIDNTTPIDYEQLYAQVYHQLTKEGAKY
ncbi:MAG: VapE domain-containing protein [Prevotella sp.]